MRRPRYIETIGIGALAAVLVAAPVGGVAPGAVASAAEVTILQSTFTDGDHAPWVPNGSQSPDDLVVVPDPDDAENPVLSVTGRTDNYDGISLDVVGLLAPGQEYTISARVRLVEGEPATNLHFAVEHTTADGTDYPWFGAPVDVTDEAWVGIGGTYTFPAGATAAKVYLESFGDVPLSDYLVDDIVLVGPEPDGGTPPGGGTTVIHSTSFEEGTSSWVGRGSAQVARTDVGSRTGAWSLAVTGRTASWHGAALTLHPLIVAGQEYEISAWVALPPGTEGSTGLKLTVAESPEAYVEVSPSVTTTQGEWALLSGTYTMAAGVTGATLYVEAADATADFLVDDVLIEGTAPSGGEGPGDGEVVLSSDFEDGLQGWVARADGSGAATVGVTTAEAHGGEQAAIVTDRISQGQGIGYDVTDVLQPGVSYEISAWVKLAESADPAVPGEVGDIWLSMQRDSDGVTSYETVGQFAGVGATGWTEITATYRMQEADYALLYLETAYPSGTHADFLLDDVVVTAEAPQQIEELTPLKDTVPFPVGVAVDERETSGAPSQLLLRHFDQITAENHMKPDYWYDGPWEFRAHPQAEALMRYAVENDLDVYGHTLVWHSQTPEWFFQDAAGGPLTDGEADRQVMRERMRTHIFAVAEHLAGEYGEFGGGNPITAWDVVNEVVADGTEFSDGLRRSEWYRILGEEFIDLAFRYADEAFNDVYAADGAARPVALFINDYNTEQGGKQQRYRDLVERLLEREVPVDGVGHQFHVNLAMPVSALAGALDRFADLDVVQAVTELDVTTGTPVTERNLIEQGYYYRDAFAVFRDHADQLFAVSVWGLNDGRSWRSSSGAPLLFDDSLRAKPAYYGAAGAELPPRQQAANVFRGEVALGADALDAVEWSNLPLHRVADTAGFQLRWEPEHLTAYVEVQDATPSADDVVELVYGEESVTVPREGGGDGAVVVSDDDGYALVVRLPLTSPVAEGDTMPFDVHVTDGGSTSTWNTPGVPGTLTLVEELSFVEIAEAPTAPSIDGEVDPVWDLATAVATERQIEGEGGASAEVKTLWQDDTLYVLAEVTDAALDASASDPWVQDSLEIFLDAGNHKNGPYREEDTQIRISYLNEVSFGTGDEALQRDRLVSQTSVTDTGYVVEAAISLLEHGGAGSFHGLDFQVNDGTDGVRTAIRSWADPTGLGYQSTARWGVGQLVEAADEGPPPVELDPRIGLGSHLVPAGNAVAVELSGFAPEAVVELQLVSWLRPSSARVPLGEVRVGAGGAASADVVIPRRTSIGIYGVVAQHGEHRVSDTLVVLPPLPPKPPWWPLPWPW